MNLKTPKKLLADILSHALKREVKLITKSDMYWGQAQKSTELTTFKRAETIHATPQDLSTVWRRA